MKKYLKKIPPLNCIIYRSFFRSIKTEGFYMKKILKGTVIFAACVTLAACGMSSPQDITVQSITEPAVTVQTVGKVPTVTAAVTENTDHWTEPAAVEGTSALEAPDDTYNNGAETLAGMTFPEETDEWEYADIIRDLFYQGLPVYTEYFDDSGAYYRQGNDSYSKCDECYKKLLTERFLDDPEAFELFGGAFFCGGCMHMMITDWERLDDIFDDTLAKLNSGCVRSCNYSYTYLVDVMSVARQNEKATGHFINLESNCVEIYGDFTDEDKENIFAALEAAGLDTEAVEIMVADEIPVANPC